jgi:hypothetical protein
VDSILARGKGRYFEFWDFGHLLWRPVGWVAFHAWGPLLARFLGPDQRAQAALALIVVSWLAGLASALLLLGLVQAYCASEWIAALVATAFIFSTAELNYSRSGSPYIPGLALLLLGMCLLTQAATRPAENAGMPALAGLALAGSVSLWFLYLLAVPAAIFVPFMWEASNKERFRISASALLVFSLAIVSIYLLVLSRLGFAGPAEILSWARSSSHGIVISGVSRTIFGWPRSFLALDEAGRVIKRIELGDPFHPVSSRDLFRLSYAGAALSLFYVSVVSIIFKLRRSWRGRKILLLAAMAAFPVLGFAMHWSGGDLERYLPLYPAFFLALGLSLADRDAWRATNAVAWTLVLCVVFSNSAGFGSNAVRRSQAQTEDRVHELLPRLRTGSLIIVSHNLDDLIELTRNFPFSAVNRSADVECYPLLTPGLSDIAGWREKFASRALRTWSGGGAIWISRRAFQPIPQTDWNWVEGDDRRVSWRELSAFLSRFQYGEAVGGDDGFVLLLPSIENRTSLALLGPREPPLLPASVRTRNAGTSPKTTAGSGRTN